MNEIKPTKSIVPVREVTLDFATSDKVDETGFIVIPPHSDGKMDAVKFKDASIIRRTIGEKNQMFPYELIQKTDSKGVPSYKLGDPNFNVIPKPRTAIE